MSFIQSVNQQWHKGELSKALCEHFQQQSDVAKLFVGATSLLEVTDLIAALAINDIDWQGEELTELDILIILASSTQLLVAKSLQDRELIQADYLMLKIAEIQANKALQSELAAAQKVASIMLEMVKEFHANVNAKLQQSKNMF
ncbi:hypothetical protein [Paraferrimonas haliotis]|uniref:hypothetical protein n=1 Tax=Paraferrimonas haliotis TaxID=2013866 RepID=UPI000BA954D6|nr:hypothetical protein [Paraferrimonas haliotis]